jgi:acetoin utilization protein AcuC
LGHRPAAFISHPIFLAPAFGEHHPLSINRHRAVVELAVALGFLAPADIRRPPLPDRSTLERVHDPLYLDALQQATASGVASHTMRARYNLGTMECPIFPGLWDRARASVGGAVLAAQLALEGTVAFHPGGGTHHGQFDRASGFCYLNDPVFAVKELLDGGLRRVAYVDLDAHHGDGVQSLLMCDDRVRFASIHEAGRWPYSGALNDIVDGRACNLPVPAGINDNEHALLMQAIVLPFLDAFAPDGVVITLGADALRGDPLSKMGLTNQSLWQAADACLARVPHAVVLGGGGYNPWTTARLWAGFWGRLSGHDLPGQLPAAAQDILNALDCDLIDEDDRDRMWMDRLVDQPDNGPIRPEIADLVRLKGR